MGSLLGRDTDMKGRVRDLLLNEGYASLSCKMGQLLEFVVG